MLQNLFSKRKLTEMKNLLTLHEAVILLKQPNRTDTFQRIANEVERRNLFTERKGGITLAEL